MKSSSISYNYIKSKDLYVFSKRGIYWGLTLDEIRDMHELTKQLLAEADEEQE